MDKTRIDKTRNEELKILEDANKILSQYCGEEYPANEADRKKIRDAMINEADRKKIQDAMMTVIRYSAKHNLENILMAYIKRANEFLKEK